ncbi:MAG: hypothetical protein HZA90_20265, partial [Verrucomicrobia bacterium]|nr:hypothetical protein [Verrucomicrobiota bacterium]
QSAAASTSEDRRRSAETPLRGQGSWKAWREIEVAAKGNAWVEFKPDEAGAWVRLKASRDCGKATAFFHFSNADRRGTKPATMFAGLAKPGDKAVSGGLLYARGANLRTLRFAAETRGAATSGESCYDLDANLTLRRTDDSAGLVWMRKNLAIPTGVISADAASVLYVDEQGRRWRLPKGDAAFDGPGLLGDERVAREVCTERDLLNVHGTFYELPAENAGGFTKVRPIATHNRRIKDYASWRGLLVMSGVAADAPKDNPHLIRSDDGQCALWVGAVDDLWQFGKPRGQGGPWKDTAVKAGEPGDAYLMTGYDQKRLVLAHAATVPITFRVEADFTGTGTWAVYRELTVPPGVAQEHRFPDSFAAYWVRLRAGTDCQASATFHYE